MSRVYDPIDIARQFRFVRELPGNRGQRVEAIQHWGGGEPGQSWCAYFVSLVFDICYQGEAPFKRTGSCDDILNAARAGGWVRDNAAPGDIVLSINPSNPDDAHHVGIVTEVDPLRSIAGNTDELGLSSNGTGVFEHDIDPTHKVFVAVPFT